MSHLHFKTGYALENQSVFELTGMRRKSPYFLPTSHSLRRARARKDKGRCLNHAGPKAANEHHERLWREFQSGKLSPANWHRHEAKRAANRLHDKWKKDPWLPGWTIDLGQAEGEMTDSLRDFGVDGDRLAPAVVDWLRWRYRRTQPEETLEAILATP